jgi:uncharacterized protein YjbI with pentapeptide repeats
LRRASLEGANLEYNTLSESDQVGVNLNGAGLTGVNLKGVILEGDKHEGDSIVDANSCCWSP